MVREVLGIEPLTSTSAHAIADAVTPTLTRHLIGPLIADQA